MTDWEKQHEKREAGMVRKALVARSQSNYNRGFQAGVLAGGMIGFATALVVLSALLAWYVR